MKLIKSFFSFYNKGLDKKLRSKRLLLRFRRLSSHRIYLSRGEFKHVNNNVLINIYTFNRQKHNYLSKLKNKYLKNFLTVKVRANLIQTLKSINTKCLDCLREVNKDKFLFLRVLYILENNKNYKLNTFKSLSNYTTVFYKKVLKKSLRKLRLYFLYKQLIYLNKSKFNSTYLRLLKKHLENLYNKNVEFNLIDLNRFYLNSDILFESVKLKLTRSRRNMRKVLKKLKDKVKVDKTKLSLSYTNKVSEKLKQTDDLKLLKYIVLNNLKYKHVTGFRLEAKGRLSKRFTASRSVSKLIYKGNLLNQKESYGRLSSVLLKGNLKSNLQYTKLNNKTRIGTFGLKG